jgi:serine/threonine-protein kinase
MKKARDLGSYQLGSVIGSGGMGEVFRAQHRLLARPAAIKLIRPDLLGAGMPRLVAIERFRREARAAALLQSPHTISLFDFGATGDGAFYYAMELLDGPSFEQLVERFGPVSSARAIHLLRQACDSIAEAHARGMIHRDIKPSNLVATRLGLEVDFVKVLDFGLVKFNQLPADRTSTLTAPDMATGTPAFMAPEAAMGERTADHRMDIYSLGCVAYWLVTGHLLFEGDTPVYVMKQHIVDPPIPPSKRTELPIPPELDALILACLEKNPADRPATALVLDEMLAAVPVTEPWTAACALRWWDEHLPPAKSDGETWDQGTLMPQMSSP